MRLFEIKSPSFLEDEIKDKLSEILKMAFTLEFENDKMRVII